MTSINIQNLSKSYGNTHAVQHLSLEVKKGELFGLIGPDGAGKTTVFRMLTTLLLPDEGNATVEGLDIVKDYKQIRKIVGYMPGRFSLYQDLTVEENLIFFATVFGTTIAENYDLIKDIYEQIKPFSNRRAGKLSGGMKQKLALCCALIHKPKVQGKILSTSTPQQIVSDFGQTLYAASTPDIYSLLQHLRQQSAVESCYPFGEFLHLTLRTGTDVSLFEQKLKNTFADLRWSVITPTIEDSFIRLMSQLSNESMSQ